MVTTGATLFRKTARDIVKNHKQFLAVIIIAALAVCLFTGFTANSKALSMRVNKLYDAGNIADLWVYVSSYDERDKAEIEKLAGVAKVEEKLVISGIHNSVTVNSLGVYGDAEISKYAELCEGSEGFLLEKHFAAKHRIKTGDEFLFEYVLPGGSTINVTFTVTGLMTHPECIDNSNNASTYFYAFAETIKEKFAEELGSVYPPAVASELVERALVPNRLLIKAEKNASENKIADRVRDYYSSKSSDENNLISCYKVDEIPTNAGIMSDIVQSKQMTMVFPVIFFAVALLVILTTVSQIIIREKMQIGLMKAVGVSNKDIYKHYISLTVCLVLLGFAIGLAVGPFLVPNVMDRKYKILFALPPLKYAFPLIETLLCFALFVLSAALVAYFICRKEIVRLPADSMRPASPPVPKKLLVEKAGRGTSLKNMPVKMALRNIKVKKSRAVMVIAGITGCMALLICGFGVEDTLNYGIMNDTQKLFTDDINVTFVAAGGETDLSDISGIERVENYSYLPVNVMGKSASQTMIRVINDNSEMCGVDFDDGTVAISVKTAKETGLKKGDRVSFTALGTVYESSVGLVYEAFSYHGIIAKEKDFPDFDNKKNGAWVRLSDDADLAAVKGRIEDTQNVASAMTSQEFENYVNDAMSSISMMTFTLKIFAVALAVIVLYNIALLNYRERQRDIATMKVIGLNKREIAVSLVFEIMLLTLVGAVAGMFLGLPTTMLVLSINETPIVSFLYRVNAVSYVYSALITLGTALIVNLILANLTDGVSMSESLKSYE